MLQRMSAVLVVSVVAAVPAAAQGPAIEHQPVGCVVAGRFPRLEARFAPANAVAKARVQFQSAGGRHWYGVAMKPVGTAYSAVLPKPKKDLKAFRYYVEVVDTALGTSRTPEYSTTVAANTATCADASQAGGAVSAAVKLEVPAGAPSVPGGFSASGVIAAGAAGVAVAAGATTAAAAGGGISTAAVLIGGGLVAAGAGVAVAASAGGRGDGGGTTYEGTFAGQYVLTQNIIDLGGIGIDSSTTCFHTRSFSGRMNVRLEPSGGTSLGRAEADGASTATGVTGGPTCTIGGPGDPLSFRCALSGTPGAFECGEETTSTAGSRTSTTIYRFTGALSGGVISGMVTFTFTGRGVPNPSTGVTDSATTTFAVTLQ